MLECDDPAPTVFDKTAYIKYHFSCTVKSSTKNTRETKSTRQTRKITFESWFWLPKNRPFCRFSDEHYVYLSPAQNGKWNVHCEFSTADSTPKLTSTKPGKKCRITGLVGASSQKVGCQSPQFFVKRRVHCCLFTFKLFKFCWLLHRIQDSEQIHVL